MHDSYPLKARKKLNRLTDLLSAFQESMLSILLREVDRHELTLPQYFVLTLIAEGSDGVFPSQNETVSPAR